MNKYWRDIFAVMDALNERYREKETRRVVTDPEEAKRLGVPVGHTLIERVPPEFKVWR